MKTNHLGINDEHNDVFTEVHLLAGKLLLVVAIHSLGGSRANWLHTRDQLLFTSIFFTLAQMCQPPSVSPCAHVLAYFHKHFQGC